MKRSENMKEIWQMKKGKWYDMLDNEPTATTEFE